MAVWPYTTQRWQRLRRHKLREDPLCEVCLKVGFIEPAVAVDHIQPLKAGGVPYPGLAELASLCASHHNLKTRGEQLGRTLAPKVVNGCDVDGRPLNQLPWSRG